MYKFGLIGNNINYSKSPDIFRAIFDFLKISGEFEVYDVDSDKLKDTVESIKTNGTRGVSVTIPYKTDVIPHLDGIDPIAATLGAVNCVSIENSKLHGFNTDCFGFAVPLHKFWDKLKNGRAIVLGAGGVAGAVVYSLVSEFEIEKITMVGRDILKLEEFKKRFEKKFPQIEIDSKQFNELNSISQMVDIFVNCTPLGGWNFPDQSPFVENFNWETVKIYYDLNYNRPNMLIERAKKGGLVTIDGSAMLVGQALRSFEIWTGQVVPFGSIYAAVFGESLSSGLK